MYVQPVPQLSASPDAKAHVTGSHASGPVVYAQPVPQVPASPGVKVQSGSGSAAAHESATAVAAQYSDHVAAETAARRWVHAALDALAVSPEHSALASVASTHSASLL